MTCQNINTYLTLRYLPTHFPCLWRGFVYEAYHIAFVYGRRGAGAARARGRRWQRASSAGSRSHQNIQISREKITGRRFAKFVFTSQEPRVGRSILYCAEVCSPALLVCGPVSLLPPRRRCQLGQDAARAHLPRSLTHAVAARAVAAPALDTNLSVIVSSVMEAVYPAAASALARGRRARRGGVRARHRTMPVTFAEIKEVDEENEEEAGATAPPSRGSGSGSGSGSGERRRPDVLDERLGRQFVEFRRRRRRDALPEPPDEPAEPAAARAGSEPLEPR